MPFFNGYLAQGIGTGTAFVENNAGGYARQPVTLQPLYLGSTSLAMSALFAGVAGPYTVTQRALFDAPSGGNLIHWWSLQTPVSVHAGGTDAVNAGALPHRYPELVYGDPTAANKVWPAGAAVGLTDTNKPIYSGVMTIYSSGSLKAASGYASIIQPVGHKVGLTGEGSTFVTSYTWFLSRYQHTMGPQSASDLQLVYGNYSGGAVPEANPNPITVAAEIEYGGISYPVTFSSYVAGSNPNSVSIPGGALVTSDPLPVLIPAGASYYTRTLISVTAGNGIPAARLTQPQLNEMLMYGTGTAPQTPLGADLTTSAATAAGSNVLTFSATSITAFGAAVLAVGAQLRGAGLYPNTTVTAFTSTTLTISPAAAAAVASGAVIHVYGNRPANSVGGYGPSNVLGRVRNKAPAVLIFGDSIAAGKYVSAALPTNAAAAMGATALSFASTALTGAVMFPGIEVPAWLNAGVPPGTVVGSFNGTTVNLVNAATQQPAALTAAIAVGTSITFGQQCDPVGNAGYVERGLVTGLNTAAPAPAVAWSNVAVSGDTLYDVVGLANGTCRFKLLSQGFTHAIDQYGINDFSSNTYPTLAAFQAAKLQFWNLLASYGLKVVACTIFAETNSTDGWNTAVNQTARSANFAVGGICQQYNDWIRTLPFPLVGVIDAADVQQGVRDTMVWTSVSLAGASYPMTVDGTHPTGPAQLVMPVPVANAVAAGVFT